MPRSIFYGWLGMGATIAALSLWPEGVVSGHYYLDKLAHLSAYGALAGVPALFSTSRRTVLTVALALIAIGAALEIAQFLLPDRWPSLFDLSANIAGVIAGTLCGWLVRKFFFIWYEKNAAL
jgi:VanZ family protein